MCKRIKVWFHNIKEWFLDQHDYIYYQKHFWHRSNFFIFLNWLSRNALHDTIGDYVFRVHEAEREIKWALDEEIADDPQLVLMHVKHASERLKRAEKAKEEIFKI